MLIAVKRRRLLQFNYLYPLTWINYFSSTIGRLGRLDRNIKFWMVFNAGRSVARLRMVMCLSAYVCTSICILYVPFWRYKERPNAWVDFEDVTSIDLLQSFEWMDVVYLNRFMFERH